MSKQVALVLGSGGARGYAHIGVIEELEARGYEITCIAGCSMGSVIGGIYAAGKLREYREWVESLDYLDVLRLLDVSFRLGAIRGERVFGKIHEILGEVNIEDLSIPTRRLPPTSPTSRKSGSRKAACTRPCASAAIPSLFTPVMQGSRMLVDGGLLNPLPIVPVVSAHSDLIIAVNLNATNQKQYHLPVIERPAALKGRFDSMIESLGHKLVLPPPRRRQYPPELSADALLHPVPAESEEPAEPQLQPAAAPQGKDSPKSASGTTVVESSGPASLLELVNQSFEVMQTSLAQYKIAGYPPDILINVPKRVCRFFEFYKAPELIALGRQIASDTLDRYEEDNA